MSETMSDTELLEIVERERLRQEAVKMRLAAEGGIIDPLLGRWVESREKPTTE